MFYAGKTRCARTVLMGLLFLSPLDLCPLLHTLLEVIPNAITHGLTDPKEVYVLRWIAGRHAGVPEFTPPYTIGA
jgi:hypothetical protein